ncbi:MAG: hypothetical protein AB1512_02845 [Thermodesulfobacteriota bacterium]
MMGVIRRMLGYATIGAATVSARRAWESDGYLESAISAAETGLWAEAARNLLGADSEDVAEENAG